MKKTTGKKPKIWLVILLSLVIFLGSICIAGIVVFKHYYGMMNIENEDDIYEAQDWEDWEDWEDEELLLDIEESEDAPATESDEAQSDLESPDSDVPSENEEDPPTEQTDPVKEEEITPAETTKPIETTQEIFKPSKDMEATEDIFRILLIGVDSRENNFRGRSDSMILFDINSDNQTILMTSILRDIYVDIPGYKPNRLNAAYAFGGAKLLTKTIYSSFGIEVDKYVTINFDIVRDVVDALGGVEVNLTQKEVDYLNKTSARLATDQAGDVTLNGKQALAYARIRKLDSDFRRTNRQRNVVMACIEKLKTMSISQIDDMLEEFLSRITTNLTEKDILTLLLMAVKRKDYSIESMAIPVSGTWEYVTIDGKAVIDVDFAANTKAWYDKVTGEE